VVVVFGDAVRIVAAQDLEEVVAFGDADPEPDLLEADGALAERQSDVELHPLVGADLVHFDRVDLAQPVEAARDQNEFVLVVGHVEGVPFEQHVGQPRPEVGVQVQHPKVAQTYFVGE